VQQSLRQRLGRKPYKTEKAASAAAYKALLRAVATADWLRYAVCACGKFR